MTRFLKIVLGLIVGTICGGLIGASMLALPTYLDKGCGPLGCVKDWAIVGIYLGLILGGASGAIIGFIVGILSFTKRPGAAVGALAGSIIMIVLFSIGAAGDSLVSAWAVLSVPAGALVGLIVSTFVGLLNTPRTERIDLRL